MTELTGSNLSHVPVTGLDPLGLNSAGLPVPHQGTTSAWTSSLKCGADIRAAVPGTASAIKHDGLASRDVLGPFLQVLDSVATRPGSVEQSPGDVGCLVEEWECDTKNERSLALGHTGWQ